MNHRYSTINKNNNIVHPRITNISSKNHFTRIKVTLFLIIALVISPKVSYAITTTKTSSLLTSYKPKSLIKNNNSNTRLFASQLTGISLDQPLLSSSKHASSNTNNLSLLLKNWKSFMTTILFSDVCKATIVAFVVAFGISMLTRIITPTSTSSSTTDTLDSLSTLCQTLFKKLRGNLSRFYETYILKLVQKISRQTKKQQTSHEKKAGSIPMSFDNNKWGICTLHSKTPFAKNPHFLEYKFALPRSNLYIPLQLGQSLLFSSLDDKDQVVTGDFYLSSARHQNGFITMLLPKALSDAKEKGYEEKLVYTFGNFDRFQMARVLETELQEGDEIAIQPAKNTFTYNGPYLPITDMVYVTSGLGIIPILQMLEVILPDNSSSTVKSVSIIWINDDLSHFELAYEELEKYYYKFSKKLDVSCISMDDLRHRSSFRKGEHTTEEDLSTMSSLKEMDDAIPIFSKGTMAVVSGPSFFVDRMEKYLQYDKGYPDNCMSLLP